MKLKVFIIMIIILCLLVVSCSNIDNSNKENSFNKENNMNDLNEDMKTILLRSNNERIADDLITQNTDVNYFLFLKTVGVAVSRGIAIDEFDKKCKIECLRLLDDYCYSIHKTANNGYYLSFFRLNKQTGIYKWESVVYTNKDYEVREELLKLTNNNSFFSEARNIDPLLTLQKYGDKYVGTVTSIDGYEIEIKLKGNSENNFDALLITEIISKEGTKDYTNFLLPIDYSLIHQSD